MGHLYSKDHGPPSQRSEPVCSCSVLHLGIRPPSNGHHQHCIETSFVNKTSYNSVNRELRRIDCFVLYPVIFSPCYFCLCNFASFAGPCGEIFSSLGLLHKEVRGQDQPYSNTPSTVRGLMSRSRTHSTRVLGLCWATPSSLCMDCYTPFCLHWEFALFLSFTCDAGFGSSSLNLSGQRTVILLPCHSSSPT